MNRGGGKGKIKLIPSTEILLSWQQQHSLTFAMYIQKSAGSPVVVGKKLLIFLNGPMPASF